MTTHVFIVDANTFQYHLQYQFVGTGASDKGVDFNNISTTELHHGTENGLVAMIADFSRVQVGDNVIFYLQQRAGVSEGKFYGVFKVKRLMFLETKDEAQQYLRSALGKSLIFRCLIEPYQVYAEGVSEWEALDEIKGIQSPHQMLWSLIYRKLKGNRGNTMITMYESERLIKLIRDKNHRNALLGSNFAFDLNTQQIITTNVNHPYIGQMPPINILPRLIAKYNRGNQFETHLQAYILQHFYATHFDGILQDYTIDWLGNEVSCGVGMQRIDIMAAVRDANDQKIVIPIELKSCCVYSSIIWQMQRYVDWIEQYYVPNCLSDIQPMIVCRKTDKNSSEYITFCQNVLAFNQRNNTLPLVYVEFDIINNNISFTKVF